MLGFQKLVHCINAVKSAHTTFFVSASLDFGMKRAVHVDPDCTRLNPPSQSLGASEVGTPNTGSKSKPARICAFKGFIVCTK
jgi:hypothetical protein